MEPRLQMLAGESFDLPLSLHDLLGSRQSSCISRFASPPYVFGVLQSQRDCIFQLHDSLGSRQSSCISRLASRPYVFGVLQSQRDCIFQPRVARNELPWVGTGKTPNPEGVLLPSPHTSTDSTIQRFNDSTI